MNMYVLQVKPGYEESAARLIAAKGYRAMCPTKEMYIHSSGTWTRRISLVFTQYIFVECDIDEAYYKIKSVFGVVRFLGHGKPEPLKEHEKAYINWIYNNGKAIEASKVYVTMHGDKMILSGLLREYKDDIINLDLRQRRAKIKIPFCGEYHIITIPVISI